MPLAYRRLSVCCIAAVSPICNRLIVRAFPHLPRTLELAGSPKTIIFDQQR